MTSSEVTSSAKEFLFINDVIFQSRHIEGSNCTHKHGCRQRGQGGPLPLLNFRTWYR